MSQNNPAATPAVPSAATASSQRCCGGPAPRGINACCARDAEMKRHGGAGCGCLSPEPFPGISDLPASCC